MDGPPEPHEPSLRASDAERDAVAARLREAHAEGRLTVEELSERLDAAFAARTRGELAPLTRDLPEMLPGRQARTGDEARPVSSRARGEQPTGLAAAWGLWVLVVGANVLVWAVVSLATTDLRYFWPVWVAGPWGAVLLAASLARGRRRGDGPR